MPNTEPTVDSAAVLGSLIRGAQQEGRVPVGFLACITSGLRGEELTEMAELRDAGALGFTDNGKPVVSAGMLRKAIQYQRLAGGVIALHEEDPPCRAPASCTRARLRAAGHGGYPIDQRVDDGRPRRGDRALPRTGACTSSTSRASSRSRLWRSRSSAVRASPARSVRTT